MHVGFIRIGCRRLGVGDGTVWSQEVVDVGAPAQDSAAQSDSPDVRVRQTRRPVSIQRT